MSFSTSRTNRPFKFGSLDRREFITQNSEVSLRVEYDANDNPIYVGRARVGSDTANSVWQIQSLSYDGSNNLISIKWAENSQGNASSEYEFAWDLRAGYTYA